jgi:hypothetical protein
METKAVQDTPVTATTQTVTAGAAALTRAILNASLFACADDTLPVLCAIHLKAADGSLRAEATDRYVASMEDLPCDGGPLETVIDSKDAVRVVKALAAIAKPFARYHQADEPKIIVTVTSGTSFATLTLTGYPGPDTALTAATIDHEYVKIDRLVPSGEGAFTRAFNGRHLARLAKVDTGERGDRIISLQMDEGNKPALATWDGEDGTFRVLVMPTRPAEKNTTPRRSPSIGDTVRFETSATAMAEMYTVTGIDYSGVNLERQGSQYSLPRSLATALKMTVVPGGSGAGEGAT